MIIIGNKEKTIQYELDNEVLINDKSLYSAKLPKVECSDKIDAEFIQTQVNTFVSELIQKSFK